MYVIIAPIQIKAGFRDQFIEEMIGDAQGSVNNEAGCLRFDVIADPKDANRIWLYEVYKDEQAFQEHMKAHHFIKWRDAVESWRDEAPLDPVVGGSNIWPPDEQWVQ